MGLKNEIREVRDKKYEVIKTPCHCMCHKEPGVIHFVACCNDGFIEHLIEIKNNMETTTINTNEVKKELYRSKVNAKFSHYTAGNVYYTVELSDGIYQFPMPTTEKGALTAIENIVNAKLRQLESIAPTSEEYEKSLKEEIETIKGELNKMLSLSSDLGITTFCTEVKGSDLNRWIAKAIEKNDFIKVS